MRNLQLFLCLILPLSSLAHPNGNSGRHLESSRNSEHSRSNQNTSSSGHRVRVSQTSREEHHSTTSTSPSPIESPVHLCNRTRYFDDYSEWNSDNRGENCTTGGSDTPTRDTPTRDTPTRSPSHHSTTVRVTPRTTTTTTTTTEAPSPKCGYPDFPPILIPEHDDYEWNGRRQLILGMARESWDSYVRYAWGEDELRPLSRKPWPPASSSSGLNYSSSSSAVNSKSSGATIVASLDTLYIMGLDDEYTRAKEWILHNLKPNKIKKQLREKAYGALLATYALSGDESLVVRARELASAELKAVLMRPDVNDTSLWSSLFTSWQHRHLEFGYLSALTGDERFNREMAHAYSALSYATYTTRYEFLEQLGAYLLMRVKSIHQSPEKRASLCRSLDQTIGQLERSDRLWSDADLGLTFVAPKRQKPLTMSSATCGTYASLLILASKCSNSTHTGPKYREWANQLGTVCSLATNSTGVALPPDTFNIHLHKHADERFEADRAVGHSLEDSSIAEAYFTLWRLTGNSVYREWAWQYAQALYAHSRTGSGFTSVTKLWRAPVNQTLDHQPATFLSSTLKYLYLTFSPEGFLPLEGWLFNADGHPLPVRGRNKAFPAERDCQEIVREPVRSWPERDDALLGEEAPIRFPEEEAT